tara:strand:+ start:2886 stop:3401 length:516 start_codon:yes stop_codon:yes gene_type:complete
MTAVTHASPVPPFIRRMFALAAVAVAVLAGGAALQPAAAGKIWFEGGSSGSAAIRGYDVVAYFTQAKPVAGKADFSHSWNNAEWRFASAENRDLFAANPEKYAPQYGGWCAWAVSQGYTAPIDPEAWRIVDGKLYLNYSKSVQQRWARDVPGNISKSDRNWPGIREKLVAK